jgi:C1A family cysteine protease
MDMKPKKKERWHRRLDEMAIKVNEQMSDLFSEYYRYDYQFIDHQDLNMLYSKEEYPFAIIVDSYSSTSSYMSGNGQMVTSTAIGAKFRLYHRTKRKYYQYGNLLIGIKRISAIKGKRLIKRLNKAK